MLMISGADLPSIDHSNEKFDSVFPGVIRSDQHLVAQGIDYKNRSALESVADRVMDQFGRIGVLVNTV
jgi:NAD(P)-dependent dehydrogenase (short-subunit alcohol dehydrogenase family)